MMKPQIPALAAALSLLASCANPHFLPRTRPLFPGLNEHSVSVENQAALSQAKADFLQVKHGNPPVHARLVQTLPHSRSKVYQGQG
jgi:hypothetical protein